MCVTYGLELEEYEKWLECLFVLLAVGTPGQGTILDMALRELFATSAWGSGVYSYIGARAEQVCLLSDRGFNTLANDPGRLIIEFNVAARIFVRYVFLCVSELLPERARKQWLAPLMLGFDPAIRVVDRDLDALADYNQRTLYQSKERVYSASASPYGVSVDRGSTLNGQVDLAKRRLANGTPERNAAPTGAGGVGGEGAHLHAHEREDPGEEVSHDISGGDI